MTRAQTSVLLFATFLLASSCTPTGGADAGADADGADASLDAELLDSAPSDDTAPDTGAPDDAPPDVPDDAGPPCECKPVTCQVGSCGGAVCTYEPALDGTLCDDPSGDGVCLAGTCTERPVLCGDGFRRVSGAEREACDDGNAWLGDACDDVCSPTPFAVTPPGTLNVRAPGPRTGVGIDDRGFALYAWLEPTTRSIRFRLYNPSGVPSSTDSQVLYADFRGAGGSFPVVLGLASGWVVAWEDPTLETSATGIGYSVVSATGVVRPARLANSVITGAQHQPAIARTRSGTDGFVMAWSDSSGGDTAIGRPVYRRFGLDGSPRGVEMPLDATVLPGQQLSIAVNDAGVVLFVWARSGLTFDVLPSVVGRRLGSTGFLDSAPVVLDPDYSSIPRATALETGDFAVAWRSTGSTAVSDIRAARVPATGAIAIEVIPITVTAVDETGPAIVGLSGDAFLVGWFGSAPAPAPGRTVEWLSVPVEAMPAESIPLFAPGDAAVADLSMARGPSVTDRRVWMSFTAFPRRITGMGTLYAVGGYLFSPDPE